MAGDKRNKRRAGYYRIDGEKYVSVTTVLNILDRPGLTYWKMKCVYEAMADDPTLSQAEALAAPYRVSGKAKRRGSAVHTIIEFGLESDLRKIPQDLRGYVRAYRAWQQMFAPTIIEQERTVVSKKYGFAGTLDMIAQWGSESSPTLGLIDMKTGKAIYPEVWLQLSALRQGLREEGLEVNGMGALLLREDGSYGWEFKDIDLLDVWLAAKRIYEWQHGGQ